MFGGLPLVLAGLFWLSQHNFLLFHVLSEFVAIAVAWALFVLVWNTRAMISEKALFFVGVAYLFVGLVDLLHTLAYQGMGVFPSDWGSNLPTQLWILARYLEGSALFLFSVFIGKKVRVKPVFAGYAVITCLALAAIFIWRVFSRLLHGKDRADSVQGV